ncbi:transmembrane protein 215-like [Megalops cyprinoides]|uniref:transmembrane protein 215-like n=1 Tax=Megalops cyprinoides TaxID=118141 RepID=UPI00186434B9|nr:transmembrane protein 215-like [Megalops cyprinoides]
MRADGINPRTGMVVAGCSVFLVFGFMFTVSGIKGEKLGKVPLLAIGPAICLPGVAAIVLANKTQGCTKWPYRCRWPRRGREPPEGKEAQEPWDRGEGPDRPARGGDDSVSTVTTVGESCRLIRSVEQDEVLRYLRACYPASAFAAARDISDYCALDRLCAPRESMAYGAGHGSVVYMPRDSIVVYSRRDSAPYTSYCCINPRDFTWGRETVV